MYSPMLITRRRRFYYDLLNLPIIYNEMSV